LYRHGEKAIDASLKRYISRFADDDFEARAAILSN
jgi:hypothetical protein